MWCDGQAQTQGVSESLAVAAESDRLASGRSTATATIQNRFKTKVLIFVNEGQ